MDNENQAAINQAMRYLSRRDYGREELYRKLLQRYEAPQAAAAVAHMVELGLMDDTRCAQNRAGMLARKGKSGYVIRCELAALGLDSDVIAGALEGLEPGERERALSVVRKNYLDKLRQGREENVMAALSRRGFRSADIVAVVGQVRDELAEEAP